MSESKPIVYVVDDDPGVREGLRRLIGSMGLAVEVFASAQAFLACVARDAPRCLLLDVELPGLSGLDLQRVLSEMNTPIPIVFLTGHGDIPMTVKAIKAGAVEFLTKPFRPKELMDAIRNAIAHDGGVRAEQREIADLRSRYESLTARERDVMAGVVAGLLTKQIAFEFGTKDVTVKEQRGQVMLKMQANSVAELVRMSSRLALAPWKGG
jgi:FixJ family two-component response regulator